MNNVKTTYMPVGQTERINYKSIKIWDFIKKNRIKLIIGVSIINLLSIYTFLITNFINLILILNR